MKKSSIVPGLLVFLLVGGALTGCKEVATESKMSTKDKANFKGGPMPEYARVEMMKRMAAANTQPPPQTSTQTPTKK
jgi:hypothetical protein